ncbi:hypothetical protein ACSBR2_027684 [Camellia fascicularis]
MNIINIINHKQHQLHQHHQHHQHLQSSASNPILDLSRNISTRSMRPPSGGPLPITVVVFDYSVGDTVCSECGLMLESHLIDETSEWRTFAPDGSGIRSFCRRHSVLGVRLLTDGGLFTVFSKPNGVTSNSFECVLVLKKRRRERERD